MKAVSLVNRPHLSSRTEREYLTEQAQIAWSGMGQSVRELKQTLGKAADIRTGARHHPLITAGSVCFAGFVTAAMLSSLRTPTDGTHAATQNVDLPQSSPRMDSLREKTRSLLATLGVSQMGVLQNFLQRVMRGVLKPQ